MTELIIGGGTLAGIITIAGFSIATFKKVNDVAEDASIKRSRIYERIDEEKVKGDNKFVNKEVCMVTHKFTSDQLKRIEEKLDEVTRFIKNNGKH